MARNYKSEYANYQGSSEQIARRSSRNKARRKLMKTGAVSKGDGMDVNHRGGSPLDNSMDNLQPLGARRNRSFPRDKKARKRNPKD